MPSRPGVLWLWWRTFPLVGTAESRDDRRCIDLPRRLWSGVGDGSGDGEACRPGSGVGEGSYDGDEALSGGACKPDAPEADGLIARGLNAEDKAGPADSSLPLCRDASNEAARNLA